MNAGSLPGQLNVINKNVEPSQYQNHYLQNHCVSQPLLDSLLPNDQWSSTTLLWYTFTKDNELSVAIQNENVTLTSGSVKAMTVWI